ncbi:hypothetical protein BABA_06236 [Neobacillus bataviensis LMG 21833]|uniref:Ferric oxidoreductase domain-containing protein n=1 Tax=Neobacillus bataviensis LMG 21833 TaxID=1117379 RepID=K6DCJ3_9BACI|nr:hypothetical protein [Neobacillus bataviensis]EKN70262.1 hypothetical protein BABA_06236 [Neobacillus bataviensis LMG 21833]
MEKTAAQSTLSIIIKLAGALAIALSVTILLLNLLMGNLDALKEINKTLGSVAEYGAIATGTLWLSRHVWMYTKRNKWSAAHYVRHVFLFLKKHHTLIGYAVLSLATSHGVYFLLKGTDKMLSFYSGIGAFAALVIVSTAGFLVQKHGAGATFAKKRKFHQAAAILFGLILLIHLIV